MADKKKSSSKHDKIEPASDPTSMDIQSLDELQQYFDQKQSALMKRLSDMANILADFENELNQKEEEKSKRFAAPSGGVFIIESKQNNLRKLEVETPLLDLEKIEPVKDLEPKSQEEEKSKQFAAPSGG